MQQINLYGDKFMRHTGCRPTTLKLCEQVRRFSVLMFPVFCWKAEKLEMNFHALNLCL